MLNFWNVAMIGLVCFCLRGNKLLLIFFLPNSHVLQYMLKLCEMCLVNVIDAVTCLMCIT